jgi:hypothetical protein
MASQPNSKLVGAFVIGFALILGAYTLVNFGNQTPMTPAAVVASDGIPRVAIEVTDTDNNGIEDWRDEFVATRPIILDEVDSDYNLPTTLTGQTSLAFFEDVLRAKNYGPFGQTPEEVVESTVDVLAQRAVDELYETKDIRVIENWTSADIKNYANAMAGAIIRNDSPDSENEVAILQDIVRRGQIEKIPELQAIASVYKSIRDESLTIPVPQLFVKQHLDLINTYNALHVDIEAMTLSLDDPALALVRIKRYEDDALGLLLSLQNMYRALEPHSSLFGVNDAAVFFANFNPNIQTP